jgi:HupE / UreJ protein
LFRALGRFNIGVELGQIIAICLVLPVMLAIGRLAPGVHLYRAAACGAGAVGAYWLVERMHFS